MLTLFSSKQKYKYLSERAQAMIEFAIVFPILMMMLIGIFEIGRLVFIYSAVNNASREAVRYGSAIGYDDDGEIKYKHCGLASVNPMKGIRGMARRSAYFMNLRDADITITYDHGPGTAVFHTCTGDVDPGYFISPMDRILVTVTGQYRPYTLLLPFGQRTIVSTSARTVLGYVDLLPSASPTSGGGGGGGGGSTPTATNPPAATDTASPTTTPTATVEGEFLTFTPTSEATPTETPTDLPTSTPTFTPTATPTVVPGCGGITAGTILISYNYMAMNITNPHGPITVSSIQVTWHTAGAPSQNSLSLQSGSLGGLFWTGSDASGNLTVPIVPNTLITIPGNNEESTILFTFDQVYENPNGNEEIVITLSDPCDGTVIRSPVPTAIP